ncbi:unnamed protein product [Pedinophyceae sp. YPF-701]|nr:unnamed protein product [Pedinophyceae sp. YPF-701]
MAPKKKQDVANDVRTKVSALKNKIAKAKQAGDDGKLETCQDKLQKCLNVAQKIGIAHEFQDAFALVGKQQRLSSGRVVRLVSDGGAPPVAGRVVGRFCVSDSADDGGQGTLFGGLAGHKRALPPTSSDGSIRRNVRTTPAEKQKRARRFQAGGGEGSVTVDFKRGDLDREYVRSAGDGHGDLRPVPVLRKALDHVRERWKTGATYDWACSNLKAIRQELTMHGHQGALVVRAYETHARFAIECGDWHEVGQCATILRDLYRNGSPGNQEEFAAYRVLYALERSNREALAALRNVPKGQLAHPYVKHAVGVCRAVVTRDHAGFFRLYADPPRMSAYLMDRLVPGVRRRALKALCMALMGTVPAVDISDHLAFETEADAVVYLRQEGLGKAVSESEDGPVLDVKAARPLLPPS